jgi:hypothetical protein
MTILTAQVATVKLGNLEFEGLKLEDGGYGIALQQVASLFQVIPTSAPKWLEGLLGKDAQFKRAKTDRFKQRGKQNQTEKILTLEQFRQALLVLAGRGNYDALLMLGLDIANPKLKAIEKNKGFVYLIQNKTTQNVKIGYSLNPCERLRALQTSNDCELTLLAAKDGTISDEKLLHKKFKAYWVRNEWFLPSLEILLHFGLLTPANFENSKTLI